MPKYQRWMKDKKWLAFVRELPCIRCGGVPSDPHHVGSRGMGLKQPDSMVIPLCRPCHTSHHDHNRPTSDWCRERLAELWAAMAKDALAEDPGGLRRRILVRLG